MKWLHHGESSVEYICHHRHSSHGCVRLLRAVDVYWNLINNSKIGPLVSSFFIRRCGDTPGKLETIFYYYLTHKITAYLGYIGKYNIGNKNITLLFLKGGQRNNCSVYIESYFNAIGVLLSREMYRLCAIRIDRIYLVFSVKICEK